MSKISITPIGTCRINTPLRRGAARYPIQLSLDRIYGFVHTAEEALQQLEFMQGERTFSEEALPILFRPGGQDDFARSVWQPTDLHFVEISSAKSYRVGDTAVQANYLTRYFADFFASLPRTRQFWALARGTGQASRAEMAAFLKADPVFNHYSEADQALLASISMRMQGFDEILADMGAIVERLGAKRVVFVTHVNTMSPDNAVIPSRDKVIRWVKLASERLGTPCFDPTALMRDFGQHRAMEREGLDTTHYTTVFADRWYAHAHRELVLPRIVEAGLDAEPGEAANPSLMAESIAATIEFDDFFDGSRQLFAALTNHPDNFLLRLLAGQVHGRIGNYPAVMELLGGLENHPDMTVPALTSLMRASYESGDLAMALELADRLIEDEYETIEVYDIASLAAEGLDRPDDAVRYAKLAFRLDPHQHRFATRVMDHYLTVGDAEMLRNWQAEIFDRLAADPYVPMARALAEWAVGRRDEPTFRAAFAVVARAETRSAERLIEEAVGQDMVIATAEAIVTMAEMPKTSSESLRNFRGLAENWPELSDARLAEGRIGEAFVLAAACVAVMPKSAEARRVERDIVLHLRSQLRDAQARGDHAAVIALGRASGHVLYRRPEIATVYVRSLLTAGHVAEALLVARQACETFPEDIDLRGLCALVAASSGEMVLALQLYGELLAHPDPVAQRYHERADRYIERAGRTGVRHVRELVEAGDFTRAVDLCFLLREYPDAKERIAGELLKVRRALRLRLRELDDEEMTGDEPLRILKLMLRIMPEEPSTLRRAALEAMKWQDFDAALGYWRELNRVSPGVESTLKNINRCQIQVQRQAARTQPALPAIAA